MKEVARALLNGGHEILRFEKLFKTAPERLRAPLVEQAFAHLSGDYLDDPQLWLKRVALLPKEKQADGVGAVARAWATQTPEEAALWAMSQPDGNARVGAISKIAAAWAARDEYTARAWMETLAPAERSAAEESVKLAGKK